MRSKTALMRFLVVVIFGVLRVEAQSNPPTVTDQTLGGTGGKFESIALLNGGVNLSIHLLHVKGRQIDFECSLNYSSKIWYQTVLHGFNQDTLVWTFKNPWTAYCTGDTPVILNTGTTVIDQCLDSLFHPQNVTAFTNTSITYPDGSQKTFPTLAVNVPPNCTNPPKAAQYSTAYSSDLSGQVVGPIFRDGSTFGRDANGNTITVSLDGSTPNLYHYVDSTGRAVLDRQGDIFYPTACSAPSYS